MIPSGSVSLDPGVGRLVIGRRQELLQPRQIAFPADAAHRRDKADRLTAEESTVGQHCFDQMAVADEVDAHQLWSVCHTGSRENGMDRSIDLIERRVGRGSVGEIALGSAGVAPPKAASSRTDKYSATARLDAG